MVKAATAWTLGLLLLALAAVHVPLSDASHQAHPANQVGGAVALVFFGGVGLIVALRQPRNVMGWILLGVAIFFLLNSDASAYSVLAYRVHHGLPLGPLAVLLQPSWAPAIVLLGLAVLLFPDAQLPSAWWRWSMYVFLAIAALWMVGAYGLAADTIVEHKVVVDATGNLVRGYHPTGDWAWWSVVQDVFFPVLGISWVLALGRQVAAFKGSTGERRLQIKWVLVGAVLFVVGGALTISQTSNASALGLLGLAALPLSIGVAILKYHLYDIDRLISRTLSYAVVTGLLIGLYAAIVVLTTDVASFSSPVAVAASTLTAAALFSPLRRRVQRLVDRRFNRSGYNADAMIGAFSARLREAVDLDTVGSDLLDAVGRAVQPAHASIWLNRSA